MPWNAIWPVGTSSVKNNRLTGADNTVYIKTTMGGDPIGTSNLTVRDHFWDVGGDVDGRHRFVQSPPFTVGTLPADPTIGNGMAGVLYLKTVLGRVQGFYRNAQGVYQYLPAFLSGTVAVNTTSFIDVVAVPANCYGQVAMYTTALGIYSGVTAHFRSNGTIVETWGLAQTDEGATSSAPLKFASGPDDATTLFIRARRRDAGAATWNYRITYRAL